MGRSYWFECSKCGYRAKVSGCADRGLDFFVQTVLCRDCKELYDAVTKLRIVSESGIGARARRLLGPKLLKRGRPPRAPPSFQGALNRLPCTGAQHFKWVVFKLQCPVSPNHRIEAWNEPDGCPRCGFYLERNALPYRIWD